MTDKITAVKRPVTIDQQQLAQELVAKARAEGVELVGAGGLLTGLTTTVLETALEAEITDHLGYDRDDPAGDRDGSPEPAIVKKRQRRLDGIDEIVLSLTARGLTTGEVSGSSAGKRP